MDALTKAFSEVKRQDFLPEDLKSQAYIDAPLPIGFGQTNSQPTTVKMMLGWLNPKPGQNILDVGAGSGWTTALLAHIVGPKGEVFAVEKVPQLVEFGRSNCHKAGVKNAKFYQATGEIGLPQFAPYDRILVSAAASKLPEKLLDQLRDGGKAVIPVGHGVLEIEKSGGQYSTTVHPGFVFVPLI